MEGARKSFNINSHLGTDTACTTGTKAVANDDNSLLERVFEAFNCHFRTLFLELKLDRLLVTSDVPFSVSSGCQENQ